jgi:serine protease Do
LGVHIQSIDENLAENLNLESQHGAMISSVQADSPAARSGLKTGDIILSFAGEKVEDARALPRMVADTDDGDKVTVTVWRDGTPKSLEVTLGSLPGEEMVAAGGDEADDGTPKLGVTLSQLSKEAKQHFRLSDDEVGVLIVDVAENSPAAKNGLQPGDIIARIGQTDVTEPAEVVSEVKRAAKEEAKSVLLLIKRNGVSRFVAVPFGRA